jgi:hypothetical protein
MIREADERADADDRPLGEAAWDVVEAGHRVLLDRIEILVLEARQAAIWGERQALLCLLAAILFATSWVGFNCTVVLALQERMSWLGVGVLLTTLNTALGCAVLAWAWKREA